MPANTTPIFPLTPNISGVQVGSAANTKSDGTGTIATDIFKAFTAGSNGSFITTIRLSPVASVAATATSATVLRIFISSQASGATTNANTFLIAEQAVPAITADQTTTGTSYYEITLSKSIPAGYTILVSSHIINASNTNWTAVVFGADY